MMAFLHWLKTKKSDLTQCRMRARRCAEDDLAKAQMSMCAPAGAHRSTAIAKLKNARKPSRPTFTRSCAAVWKGRCEAVTMARLVA